MNGLIFNIIKKNKLLAFMIFAVSVTLTAFLDEETMLNWLVIATISCSPVLLVAFQKPTKYEGPFWVFIFLFLTIVIMYHMDTVRWTTILFSIAFIIFFISFARVTITKSPSPLFFQNILKLLIYSYCIVLIIQQTCVLLGLPIFNVSAYNIIEPWKLNSLMSEPSHSARVLPILMYIYISIKEVSEGKKTIRESFKEDKPLWIAFVYACITMLSATAYIFMFIVFAKFLNKNTVVRTVLFVIILLTLVSNVIENKAFQRTYDVVVATMTFNEDKIIEADGSGSYRIVPFFRGAKAIGASSFCDYFGHGIDADMRDIEPLPGTDKGCAGPFAIWYNYGSILQLLYWFATLKVCYIKKDKVSLLVWFLCVFTYGGMNNQIVWLSMILLYSYRYCIKQSITQRLSI